jgi:hypothetical protein
MLRRLNSTMLARARFRAGRARVARVPLGAPLLVWALLSSAALTLPPRASSAAPTAAAPDVRLPPGTRADAQGVLVSGRGLRETTDFLARELARRGIAVRRIGPYRVRGVELTRFVSEAKSTSWLAIHALRTGGKTLIFFVPRPKA